MKNTIQRLNNNIARLKNEIHQLPAEYLLHKPRPEKWSKKEILGHLVDSARYNLMRFNTIPIHKGTYQLIPYPQDHLVKANDYQGMEMTDLVTLWQVLNKQIAIAIGKITKKQLAFSFINMDKSTKTLEWLILDYADHMDYHLAQILDPSKIQALTTVLKPSTAAQKLATVPTEFISLLEHGGLQIEYYQPHETDKQKPHDRDELYVIIQGKADFFLAGETRKVEANDLLFVKAGEEHRFLDFSADFATWVIFYGMKR